MKLIILKTNLLEAVGIVEKAINNNSNLPILKHFKLEVGKNNKVVFTSTNLELAIQYKTSGKTINEGTAIIPFDVFNNIVRNLVAEKVIIELKERSLYLTADNYEATIYCGDSEEYPIIPSIQSRKHSIKLSKQDLVESFGQTIIATHYSEIRPEINGVFTNYKNQNLTLAGTDSFRLVERVLKPSQIQSTFNELTITIPLGAVEILLRIVDGEGDIEFFADENQILFETESTEIISRLVDGTFPDYKSVIPKEIPQEIIASREELANAIKLTRTFSGRANDVTFTVNESKKILEVYSTNNTIGENRYCVPIKIKGKKQDVTIAFNWRYVLDALKMYSGDDVVLGITDSERPVRVSDPTEPSLTYVVMPIRS